MGHHGDLPYFLEAADQLQGVKNCYLSLEKEAPSFPPEKLSISHNWPYANEAIGARQQLAKKEPFLISGE